MNDLALTIDVEWAHPLVLADTLKLLDERKLKATFFCTHKDIAVPSHERALHPNFRMNSDIRLLLKKQNPEISDLDMYHQVVKITSQFCLEAIGVRAHCLFYDSEILKAYKASGLQYDSSYFMPFVENIRPFLKEHDILEIPFYYMDHIDLVAKSTSFDILDLKLSQQGLKVFAFHPNLIFINSCSESHYMASKHFYNDPERLLKHRYSGKGVRTLFLDLLDYIVLKNENSLTLSEINHQWRAKKS